MHFRLSTLYRLYFAHIYIRQDAYITGGSASAPYVSHAVRIRHPDFLKENDFWGPWEYESGTPMYLGTEYRTTERYLSKPVYVKVVDCGNCPESGHKDIRFDTSGVALPIRCYGNWTYDGRSTIPFETTGSDRMVVGIIGSFIRITTGGRNFSQHTCTVTVYYTKTTD